jgi:flagellar hook-associated protein 1
MSLNTSLNAALSGLTAAARATDVVSSNIANAMTEGYAPRELVLSARGGDTAGAGVKVDAVRRQIDQALLADRRIADAGLADSDARADALARLEETVGLPGEYGSLANRIDDFEAALIEAASRPDSAVRLDSVLRAAQGLAGGIAAISQQIQTERAEADHAIATEIERLNAALGRIHELNGQIARQVVTGHQPNALFDQRQQIIDSIAGLVPLREVARPNGVVALITEGGAVLVDHRPAELGFSGTAAIAPDMTRAGGALSGLTINGREVSSGTGGQMGGGRLTALFDIRDRIGPELQAGLDVLARDLVGRFEAADATSAAPLGLGLFTDAGAALDPAAEVGLALRLSVSPAVDPAAGGALWRLRDGMGATQPGDAGNTDELRRLAKALASPTLPASGTAHAIAKPFSGLAADFQTALGVKRQEAEARASHSAAKVDSLRELQLSGGVDTDAEMQKLLLIERAYSANARVLRAADDMLQTLLGI